jgi:hypothetical protein
MLAGSDNSVTMTLTATAPIGAMPPFCAITNVQNATIQVRIP